MGLFGFLFFKETQKLNAELELRKHKWLLMKSVTAKAVVKLKLKLGHM